MTTEFYEKIKNLGLREVKKQLDDLAMNVGYGLEDKLMPHLRAFGLTEFGITVSRVDRRYILYPDDKHDEINMYCEGMLGGKPVFLIGEGKAQPGKKDFDAFNKKLKRLQAHLECDIEAFMVGYQFAPTVERYADSHYPQIRRFKTFEIMTYV